MFVRCAYFMGHPVAGQEAVLRERLLETLQLYMKFDKIRSVQLLTAQEVEAGAPEIHATLQLVFDSERDLLEALATPYRQQLRAHFAEKILPLFEGTIKHINHAVDEQMAAVGRA